MTAAIGSLRAHVSDFTIRLGSATTNGRLVAVRKPEPESEFKLCTPSAEPVRQVYIDGDQKVWEKHSLGTAKEIDGKLVPVSKEELEKAKKSELPVNVINLSAHKIEEVEQFLFPSDHNSYVFEPIKKNKKGVILPDDPINVQWYEFIHTILKEGNVALVGKCNLKNYEGLYRLCMYQNHIVLSRQLWPEDLNQFEGWDFSGDPKFREKALAAAQRAVKPFDPASFTNEKAVRLAELQPGEVDLDSKPIDQSVPEFDIMDALDNFEI